MCWETGGKFRGQCGLVLVGSTVPKFIVNILKGEGIPGKT
jgi:hypothetical protein